MARPYKTGIDYFPLDVDFFVDDKMIAIAGEFGIKGEVAVIHLLCAIYRNGYYVEWNDRLRSKLDRELPGVSVDLLCMIVDRLVRWEFFDKSLFYSSSILTSKGIQRRYFEAVRKRKGDFASLPYLLVSLPGQPKQTTITAPQRSSNEPTATDPGIVTPRPIPVPQPQPAAQTVQPVILGNDENTKCLNQFFSDENRANLETFMMNLSLRPDEQDRLRSLADTIVNEWNTTKTVHRDYADWARHLVRLMQIKIQEEDKYKKRKEPRPSVTAPSKGEYHFDGGFGGQDI